MNRYYFTMLAFLSCVAAAAQPLVHRGHVEYVDAPSTMSSSPLQMRKIGSRASAVLSSMGSPKIPVVLVQFADKKFSVGETEADVHENYERFCNLLEGNATPSYGSVGAYFKEQSYGQFTPEFNVIGPVTLSKNYAYYGKNSNSMKDSNISSFYYEACKKAASDYDVDWSTFDNNNDGKVDMVFFIYAGEGENDPKANDANLIWPKEGTSTMQVDVDEGTIVFGAYGCTCEIYSGQQDGIGTMCHELSHALGLPDLYDKNYVAYGMDYWDVMDSGNYQIGAYAPICYSAYERDFMGWRDLVTLDPDEAYSLTLEPLETTGKAYKVVNKANPNEYFVLENRQNIGYDKFMGWPYASMYNRYGALHGLMITHIDYDAKVWGVNYTINGTASHQRLTIVPADGTTTSWSSVTEASQMYDWIDDVMGDLYPYTYTDSDGKQVVVREMSSYATFTGGTLGQTIDNIYMTEDGIITLDINGGTVIPGLRNSINDCLTEAAALAASKMNAQVASSLQSASTAAGALGESKDKEALTSALTALQTALQEARASIAVYETVAAIIAEAGKLGDVGKAHFAASGVESAYNLGTIVTADDAQKAYDAAVAAQAEADGVSGITTDENAVIAVFGVDGTPRERVEKGVNIVKLSDGSMKKMVVK